MLPCQSALPGCLGRICRWDGNSVWHRHAGPVGKPHGCTASPVPVSAGLSGAPAVLRPPYTHRDIGKGLFAEVREAKVMQESRQRNDSAAKTGIIAEEELGVSRQWGMERGSGAAIPCGAASRAGPMPEEGSAKYRITHDSRVRDSGEQVRARVRGPTVARFHHGRLRGILEGARLPVAVSHVERSADPRTWRRGVNTHWWEAMLGGWRVRVSGSRRAGAGPRCRVEERAGQRESAIDRELSACRGEPR